MKTKLSLEEKIKLELQDITKSPGYRREKHMDKQRKKEKRESSSSSSSSSSLGEEKDFDSSHTIMTQQWSPFPADTDYFAPASNEFMINYRVANLDNLLEILKEDGVTLVGEKQEFDYGKFAWILDCDGRKLELWEPRNEELFG